MDAREDTAALVRRIDELEQRLAECRARDQAEIEHHHALKLQALGQLTAGVAHELNTPLQFIADNLHFLRGGMHGLVVLVGALLPLRDAARIAGADPALVAAADRAEAAADLAYLMSRLERSFGRTFEGIERVTTIVQAMKRFCHPRNELSAIDINPLLETVVTLTRNELKYVAEVVLELGELPAILGHSSDLSQALLNLVINAGHAITDRGDGVRGTIRIASRVVGELVEIAVADTGCGIPAELRDRVFEPFFTTKEPGRGTGQGLALVHSVVDGHGGTVGFESEAGAGTTFWIRLPIRERGTP